VGALQSKTALIIGATSGIGARTAERFVTEGARVVIAGRRAEQGEKLAAELGDAARFVRVDVVDEVDIEAAVRLTVDRFGRLDCLVNSAGEGGAPDGITTVDLDRLRRTLNIHVGGVVGAMKHAAPVMSGQGSGSIINIASIGGHLAGWTFLDYSAAKAAVTQVTRCVAVELARDGVRVNSISPGPILTGIFAKGAGIDPAEADRNAGQLEAVFADRLEMWQPIRRVGLPNDVASVAVWLASDASDFVTGQDVAVDGGITAGRPGAASVADRIAMAKVLLPAPS
jgi:NAD(P)-dependent dehydrogenase (short-subunit alcohol dehydrogenase family)